ncbi:MAG TPA: cyclic nucleotide-binding domain-containing protein [Fimbriimonadaceae bacterium]|nr:cyclic nucleotide-binding domain-containing protein [Fimbriimonadaceae bacterium]
MDSETPDSYELLARTGLATGMSHEQVRVLADCGKVESYASGENLVSKDDDRFDLLVVVDGACEIRTDMDDLLYRLGRDSLIGEMSFLDQKPRSAKAISSGGCKAIRFPASLLDDLEATRPDIVARLLKNISLVLCQKLRSTTRFAEATFV